MSEEVDEGLVQFVSKDIYDIDTESELPFKFDVILLKDVIEHIFHQEKFMARLDQFMSSDGIVFFGFPPWQMPFGGHQQVLKSSLLSKIPYFHLLPRFLYKWILTIFGESDHKIKEMMELTETGLSIEKFERIVKQAGFEVVKKRHYLINPVYSFKFGLKPRKQFGLISAVPFLRNFLTTGVYYLIKKK
jgi:2-polyprenyl-3-methyl-5-hydroxy-6-metoxy-1,4-benzoquinol methylase